jgi:hypothetical protein
MTGVLVEDICEGEAQLFLYDADGSRARNWIDERLRRLGELIQRTDALTTKDDFDPARFKK